MGDSTVRIQSHQQYEREHLAEIEQVINSEQEIIKELWISKKDKIKKYAKTIEERLELGDKELGIFAKSQISSYIRQKYKSLPPNGASEGALAYISGLLSEEGYTRAYNKEENENSDGTKQVFKDDGIYDDVNTKKVILPKLKPVDQLTHSDLLDVAEFVKNYKDAYQHIQEYGKQAQKKADDENFTDVKITKLKQESTPEPEPRVTKFSDAIQRGIDRLIKVKEKVVKFPPDMQEEAMYAQSVEEFFSIFDPIIDEKWSADWMSDKGWLEIEKYNVIHGKHAAAVKFGGQTINGTYRPLTREEVGDQYEAVVEKTRKFYNAIPGIASFGDWYLTYVKPRILARKENISDELSEKA